MAIYYIDPGWAGAKNGTLTEPFSVWSQVPFLAPGDSVLFKRGTIHNYQVLINPIKAAHGGLINPITIGAYGDGLSPVIQHPAFVIDIDGVSGVIIQDLYLSTATSLCSGGVRVLNAGECIVRRITTNAKCDYGIRIDNNTASVFSNITVSDCVIAGTWSNSGIAVLWGSSLGGYFKNVEIVGNTISDCGFINTSGQGKGIFITSRVPGGYPITTNSGTVDKDCFAYGVSVKNNSITNTRAHAISYNGVKSGNNETVKNIISGNQIYKSGDGFTDSHALWVGASRDVVIEDNTVDNTIMMANSVSGTGVGVFVDGVDAFSGCKRVTVRRNKVSNTGLKPETTLNNSEVAGAGMMALYATDATFSDNVVESCHNGFGILGWWGFGIKTNSIKVIGNKFKNIVDTAIYTGLSADNIDVLNNYIENAAIGIVCESNVTNYREENNTVIAKNYYSGRVVSPTNIELDTPLTKKAVFIV